MLRRLTLNDAPFILELLNEPSFLRFIGDRGVRSLQDARQYLLKGPIKSYERFGFGLYLAFLKATGDSIGIAGLLKREGLQDVDVGFAFLPASWGRGYDNAGADQGNADKIGKPVSSYDDDARAVIRFLLRHPACTGKLGAIGICVGGHLSFRASMNREILAGVCFYATDIHKGSLGKGGDDTLSRMSEQNAEMLMIWGRQDPHVPAEGRALIQKAMIDANVFFTWHEFNGAHAFLRDEGPRYDPALALTCYRLAIDLFKRKLTEGDWPAAGPDGSETKH